jgi:hypothetical protein
VNDLYFNTNKYGDCAVYLNFKYGQHGAKFKFLDMTDSARSLKFKHGAILNTAVYLNFKDGGYAVIMNCNRAVYLNFNYGGHLMWQKV